MFRVSLPDVSSTRHWPHASPVIIWPAFDQTLQATKWATSLSSQVNLLDEHDMSPYVVNLFSHATLQNWRKRNQHHPPRVCGRV